MGATPTRRRRPGARRWRRRRGSWATPTPHAKTGPEELYETLKPFKDKVAQDIKSSDDDE